MNPLWAFFFKDKFRTPLSVYKMSFAEILVLGAIVFGIGYGVTRGAQVLLDSIGTAATAELN
tara:strand:- start:323 stop:508 length:186 start_codon:yes stop_codon:yes gene_type:complete